MVKNSLKKLLNKYPYFLDKNVGSNFYRVVQVQNENFRKVYQSLVDVYESFHLNKKVLVWKEQTVPYEYTMRFISTYPNIKQVKIYKNDEVIYIEDYINEDNNDAFDYSYTYDTRNDIQGHSPDVDEEDTIELTQEEQNLYNKLILWRINKTTDDDTLNYDVNIKAKFNNLKKITIYKNEESLYTQSFNNTNDETLFEYTYNNTFTPPEVEYDDDGEALEEVLTDDSFKIVAETYNNETVTKYLPSDEAEYIPGDTFLIQVETYDEYIYRKGFPEHDTLFTKEKDYWNVYLKNKDTDNPIITPLEYDDYDHDISLDYIGYLNNIPRKEYIEIETLDEYYRSEPPFNNRRTEDDYHYMKRMLEYNLRIWDTPAPILEIWKLYGLTDVSMVNREHQLIKIFDIKKHQYHTETRTDPCNPDKTYDTLVVDGWIPEAWEHKDQFFKDANRLGEYFFAEANTVRPVKKKPVTFTFRFLNSLAEDISADYTVDAYLNNELISEVQDYTEKQWICPADYLDEYNDNIFLFVGKYEDREIGRAEITVTVRGCSDADFYVRATGNDNNNGSRTAPFKTLRKALDSVTGVYNLIAVVGETIVNTPERVPTTCTLIGCKDGNITPKIINTNPSDRLNSDGSYTKLNTSQFFNIAPDQILSIQDIEFKNTSPYSVLVEDMDYTNSNRIDETETGLLYNMDYAIPVSDSLQEVFIKNLQLNTNTGLLTWTEINKSTDLTDNLSYEGIINNLQLTDNLYYNEHTTHEVTSSSNSFDKNQLYFSDREDMLNSTYYINNNLNDLKADGLLDYAEYDEEIIYDTKEHGLDEFDYQHISATQGAFTPRQASWLLGTLKINLTILKPQVGQIIKLRTSDGATATFKINSVSGNNVTYKPTDSNSSATSYVYIQAVKNTTSNVTISLGRIVTSNGFVYTGSNNRLDLVW